MPETWRDIPDWPYQASSEGNVRRAGSSACLLPTPDKDGYLRVTLSDRGRRRTFGVHILVMLAFAGLTPSSWAMLSSSSFVRSSRLLMGSS